MKLLLDVHHSPIAARRLRHLGHDVTAAADDAALARLEDDDLLQAATSDQRAVVTENARDFDRIVRAWAGLRRHHAGVVFTPPKRFHRGSKAYPENLIAALASLLDNPPDPTPDWVHWLE